MVYGTDKYLTYPLFSKRCTKNKAAQCIVCVEVFQELQPVIAVMVRSLYDHSLGKERTLFFFPTLATQCGQESPRNSAGLVGPH